METITVGAGTFEAPRYTICGNGVVPDLTGLRVQRPDQLPLPTLVAGRRFELVGYAGG